MSHYSDEDDDYFRKGIEELKRVDHLIFVSLKYTRTVDVLKSVIKRLIASFDFIIQGLLVQAKAENTIDKIPISSKHKSEELLKLFKEEEFAEYMQFYHLLRKLNNAKFTRKNEFRRHVTMTAIFDDGTTDIVNIDVINEYYKTIKSFLTFVQPMLQEESNE